MNPNLRALVPGFCLLLSACGGGGGSGNSNNGQPPPPPPVAVVTLQITTADMQVTSNQGDALPVSFEGTWSATNLGGNAVYVRALDETNNLIAAVTMDVSSSTNFKLDTRLDHALPLGEHASQVNFVACKDSSCNNSYANTAVTRELKILVEPVPEWQTHQANASHNGYVPIWVDADNFEKLWEWSRGPASEPIGGINAPVAGKGEVYVSTDVYFGEAAVVALDELTGEENWRVSFGSMPALNPPAINDDTLFVSTSGHEETKIWGIGRADRTLKFQSGFSSQWGHYLAPTVSGDLVFQTGGYYGGYTYAFSVETGQEIWSREPGTSWGMDTAAVDDEHVYVHDGATLTVLDKHDGDVKASIRDPFGNTNYDYHGAPVIGRQNNIVAFSGGAFSGRASSNAEHYENRVITSYDLATSEYKWFSEFAYKTFFAISNGVIYAGKNNPVALDAIDETTGEIVWSWVPPTPEDTEFHRNIVVTKNLLLVSTNAHLYAVDLETKESVWSYEEPGMVAISDSRIMFLAPGKRLSDGRLIAFDLRSN